MTNVGQLTSMNSTISFTWLYPTIVWGLLLLYNTMVGYDLTCCWLQMLKCIVQSTVPKLIFGILWAALRISGISWRQGPQWGEKKSTYQISPLSVTGLGNLEGSKIWTEELKLSRAKAAMSCAKFLPWWNSCSPPRRKKVTFGKCPKRYIWLQKTMSKLQLNCATCWEGNVTQHWEKVHANF